MPFSLIFQILFIIGSTFLFLFIPECLNNSRWCFLSSFSTFEDRRRVSLQSYPFSRRFIMLAYCHPLIIVLIVSILFTYPEHFMSCFPFLTPKPIILEDLFILSFQPSFSKSYRCIAQVFSNQFMISSFSCI